MGFGETYFLRKDFWMLTAIFFIEIDSKVDPSVWGVNQFRMARIDTGGRFPSGLQRFTLGLQNC